MRIFLCPHPLFSPPAAFVSLQVALQAQFFLFVIVSVAFFPVCSRFLQVWLCEFCGHENIVSNGVRKMCVSHTAGLFSDELYLQTQSEDDYQNLEDTLVVFCVDISGSMSVTTEVAHEFSITALVQSLVEVLDRMPPPPQVAGHGFHNKTLTDINA